MNHGMHTKHGMARLQMETTWAVLGDAGRSPTEVFYYFRYATIHLIAR